MEDLKVIAAKLYEKLGKEPDGSESGVVDLKVLVMECLEKGILSDIEYEAINNLMN
ncbi:hypothetical protein [Bacillus sp. SJS]|uniref:hypothetical protein n=1 Tax=Bacillus sp. SJS TaxID=1423321 RepID=UPI000AC7B4B7|nr:hypothetical protein [Bacillus sp. SJS]